jgi:hypothetical protein
MNPDSSSTELSRRLPPTAEHVRSRRPSASFAVSSWEWRPDGAEAESIVRLVVRLVGFRLDQRARACQQLRHQLAGFSILEIDAASSHAHGVDAAQDEHAVVYHDLVADFHAAWRHTAARAPNSASSKRAPTAIARTSLWKQAVGAIDDGASGPPPSFTRPESPATAQQAPLSHKSRKATSNSRRRSKPAPSKV